MSAFGSADWVLFGRQVADHIWQSTLFAALAGLLAVSLRQNHARTRHWLWMVASVKFLVPFSLVVAIGGRLGPSLATRAVAPRIPVVVEQIAQPFALSDSAIVVAPPVPQRLNPLPPVLTAVWFCGFAAILVNWPSVPTLMRQFSWS
jgi:bla regulator protein blaR1